MQINIDTLSGREVYRLMSEIIVPRPIAWVSTISTNGITNLAPFSFFQGVTSNPPTILFVPVNDRSGQKKDTIRNIEAVPEFVVNIITPSLMKTLDKTAAKLPYAVSEFDEFNIDSEPSHHVRPPRVRQAPIAMECTLDRIVTIGEGAFGANVVFGRLHIIHIDQNLIDEQGLFKKSAFAPLARLGDHYGTVSGINCD